MMVGENSYKLPRRDAENCLVWTETITKEMTLGDFKGHGRGQDFIDSISSFKEYLRMMVNSGIEQVSIPDHHREIYEAISLSFINMFGLGGLDD